MAGDTYVSLVNKAINEGGADLNRYNLNGSDFITNTDPLMNRFKVWVDRAWTSIQQVAFDWQFLGNQALVTLHPGVMFYTAGNIPGAIEQVKTIYGTDGQPVGDPITVTKIVDLTDDTFSNQELKSLGYIDIAASREEPLFQSWKAGGDHFRLPARGYMLTFEEGRFLPQLFQNGVFVGDQLSGILRTGTFPDYEYTVLNEEFTLLEALPETGDFMGTEGFTLFTTNELVANALTSPYRLDIYKYPQGPINPVTPFPTEGRIESSEVNEGDPNYITVEPDYVKAYLHSWKSFDFSEEIASNDYQNEICEIDNNSFQIIDSEDISPSSVRDLEFVPWSIFSNRFDDLNMRPGFPKFISKDNTGRWRLFPAADRPYTLKFQYARKPQKLVAWNDTPKGLPSEWNELIMWLAVRMYGEWDEQPSVQRRAERYYKDQLQRLQLIYRPKFRFAPKRLF